MSKKYALSAATKKNVIEREYFFNETLNLGMTIESLWRNGTWIVELKEGEELPKGSDTGFYLYESDAFEEVEMDSMFDGCGTDFELDMDEEDEEYATIMEDVEEAWDEAGYAGLEEKGWEHSDTDVIIYGELELEEL